MSPRAAAGLLLPALAGLWLLAPAACAQTQAATLQKAVALEAATLYLKPDASSARVGSVRPGMDIGIQSHSGDFVEVFSGVSGWMPAHGFVALDDPEAPEVIFGAAAQLENLAESASGEDQAADDAARLYLSIYGDFPASARAAEALYRGANIRWQLQLSEEPTRRTPEERQFPDDNLMRRVIGKYKDSPWAARADYQLIIVHFTCGSWFEKPQCLEKEIGRYQDYVKKYPHSPNAAEAAYDALWREGIAWTLYRRPGPGADPGKTAQLAHNAARDAATLQRLYPNTDWAALAALVAFHLDHQTPLKLPSTTPLGGP
ncbi:MAG: tetratricopeptide repeat protein [Terriglobales bacterium]